MRASSLLRRSVPELVVAAVAVVASLVVAGRALGSGFPLDDAWIHMVYGLALRTHGMLAYNDGRASTGCTSPAWAALVGLAHLLARAREPSWSVVRYVQAIGGRAAAEPSGHRARAVRSVTGGLARAASDGIARSRDAF